MRARDHLHSVMQDAGFGPAYADSLIDAYAHELAEKIRANTAHLEGTATGNSIRLIVNELAADLIDPEVNQ
jgi:hypothetical protein